MSLTRADLTDPKVSDKDKAEIAVVLERYQSNDVWANKLFSKIGVLLTSHPANRTYLKASIETHKKLGFWLVLAYDNYIDPKSENVDYNKILPAKDVIDNVDTFVMSHHQTWGGVLYPYFWLLKFGVNVLQNFEYIYSTNGDCILEHPENFQILFDLLGDADIMSCGPVTDRSVNTTGFIARTSALKAIMQHFEKHFIPFENYEKYTQEFGNAEGRFGRAIKDLGLKQVIVESPYNDQLHISGYGTWYKTIGLRHIHAEHNYAYRYKGIPPEPKYFDSRFMGDEYNQIKTYWETKDMKILENWWARE